MTKSLDDHKFDMLVHQRNAAQNEVVEYYAKNNALAEQCRGLLAENEALKAEIAQIKANTASPETTPLEP